MSDKCTRNMFYGQHQGCFKVENGHRRTSLTAFFTSLKPSVDCSEFVTFHRKTESKVPPPDVSSCWCQCLSVFLRSTSSFLQILAKASRAQILLTTPLFHSQSGSNFLRANSVNISHLPGASASLFNAFHFMASPKLLPLK